MANRSVTVLSSSGRKLRYETFKQAMASVANGSAVRESNRCIRLLPSTDGAEWRTKRSGVGGPLVRQMERILSFEEAKEVEGKHHDGN